MSHPRSCHSGHAQAGGDRGWEELWIVEHGAVALRTVNYLTYKPQRNRVILKEVYLGLYCGRDAPDDGRHLLLNITVTLSRQIYTYMYTCVCIFYKCQRTVYLELHLQMPVTFPEIKNAEKANFRYVAVDSYMID